MKTNIHFIISHSFLLREINVSDKAVVKIKTYVLCSVTLFRNSCILWGNVETYCTAGQDTDGNMAHCAWNDGELKLAK